MATVRDRLARLGTTFLETIIPNLPVALAVLALLGLAGYLGRYIVEPGGAHNPTFDFIGIVIIFLAALSVAATIFVGLKLANSSEAFGLPSGSMRALLAIGIMILFVVFGLPMVTAQVGEPLENKVTSVPAAKLEQALQLHRDQGFRVRVIDYGSEAVPQAGTTAGRDAVPARFETFGRVDLRSPEQVDFGKQILTAVITLLTSVVSFYFGSRSATEESRREGGSEAPADLAALRKQRANDLADLDKTIADAAARLETAKRDPAKAASPATAAAEEARKQAESRRADSAERLRLADDALVDHHSATAADERKRLESLAREELKKLGDLLKAARGLADDFAAKVTAIGSAASGGLAPGGPLGR